MGAKLDAARKTHSYQMEEQKRQNALLKDENKNLVKKVDKLEGQLERMYQAHLHSLLPISG